MSSSYEREGHSWVLTCWLCVLLNMVLTVPLLFQRSRQSLMIIMEPITDGNSRYYTTTAILLAVVAVCGVVLRHLDAIMMVREATIGILLMYVFPAAICMQLIRTQ